MLGQKIYIDYTKYENDECNNRLLKEIKSILNENIRHKQDLKAEYFNNKSLNNETNVSGLSTDELKLTLLWSENEVMIWMNAKQINSSIKENILPCNGRVLHQLYKMSADIPEFFYTILRSDTNSNLKDMAHFTSELKLLFNDS